MWVIFAIKVCEEVKKQKQTTKQNIKLIKAAEQLKVMLSTGLKKSVKICV